MDVELIGHKVENVPASTVILFESFSKILVQHLFSKWISTANSVENDLKKHILSVEYFFLKIKMLKTFVAPKLDYNEYGCASWVCRWR